MEERGFGDLSGEGSKDTEQSSQLSPEECHVSGTPGQRPMLLGEAGLPATQAASG